MDWWVVLILIVGSYLVLMATGMPVGFCFLLVNLVGAFIFWGGLDGFHMLTSSIMSSVTTFTLLPIPLFILMGEVMTQSGIATAMIDAIDKFMGWLPGRLGLLAIAAGTLLSTMTGVTIGSTAVVGSALVPEMRKRGYSKSMSMGPILGSGGLAMLIPPSSYAVLVGAVGQISIGKILIAIIIPGLILAIFYAAYVVLRCKLQPSEAPKYDVSKVPLPEKMIGLITLVLPVGFIIFLVTGLIFLGVATPTEAAATGAVGSYILAACYHRLTWDVVKKSMIGTVETSVMILIIVAGATAFGQILAFTGATAGLAHLITAFTLSPVLIVIAILVVILILGTFMSGIAITMITLPLFTPVIKSLGLDPVWFAVLFLVGIEAGLISPPFGLSLFVMKGIAPPDTTMGDIYRAAVPYIIADITVMAILIASPQLVLWLPGLMQ